MNLIRIFCAVILLQTAVFSEPAPKPQTHARRDLEGWSVFVDDRLLIPESELGRRALVLLKDQLHLIAGTVPEPALSALRKAEVQLDLHHGDLKTMQYHPSPGWLSGHGYETSLARRVHIPDAGRFADPNHAGTQPWCMLHELAHAYHHQVLGYDHAGLIASFAAYRDSGRGQQVRHVRGHTTRHYALTNEKEFFAEMSEAYFGLNDFAPFTREDLRADEPAIHTLMEAIWGRPRR